jgi:putative NADPH-quinone reductase
MNMLIVHAHPEPRSFTAAMRDTPVESLGAQGHAVVVSGLCAMKFGPVEKAGNFLYPKAHGRADTAAERHLPGSCPNEWCSSTGPGHARRSA